MDSEYFSAHSLSLRNTDPQSEMAQPLVTEKSNYIKSDF